jgi:tRNA wybutosine-synthesizing protein 1
MINNNTKKELESQQYRLVGNHSAVKICHWTKAGLRNEGLCYKHSFYGINSTQCLQMTTSLSCPSRCIFCWRGYKGAVSKEWKGIVDDPKMILEKSIEQQNKLIIGFKGNDKVAKDKFQEANTIKHTALSLTGEPILYPDINKFIDLCNKQKISTFLVTNAQYPELIKKLKPITQLYISLDAPNKELLKKIDCPLFPDYWERLIKSLKIMAKKEHRTALRLTLIKEMNDSNIEQYADLIKIAQPDFIEIKGYMFVGTSRQRMDLKNMPYHEDIVLFSQKLNEILDEYGIVGEHIPSRVVLLAKKEYKNKNLWNTWIDFDKWNKLVNSKEKFTIKDYLQKTPLKFIGLSGKGTKNT